MLARSYALKELRSLIFCVWFEMGHFLDIADSGLTWSYHYTQSLSPGKA